MNHKELKKAYIKLYSEMMKYIWPVNTVELLAELETSVCNVFPIMSDVRNNFRRLRADVAADLRDDEDMKKAFDAFQEKIDNDVTFANITFAEK